jgi:predicted component of type VI protein secretion system
MKLDLVNIDPLRSRIVLTEFPVIVGLDPSADVRLDDSSLGHYQCMIDHSDGTLMVWDLGTKLGTSINGVRVVKKASLQSGDELTIGRNRFVVHFADGQAKSPRHAEQSLSADRRKHRPSTGRRRQPAVPA